MILATMKQLPLNLIFMGRFDIIKRFALIGLLSLVFIISLLRLLSPISDPDFFWHIATGRWILENKALPWVDPFSYSTLPFESSREKFILTSYWLTQVIYYSLYLFSGYWGIIALRFLIFLLIVYFLVKRSHIKNISYQISLPLISLSLLVLLFTYPMDRPQVFSFLFFAALLYLLDELVAGKKYVSYVIPSLMLLWSNMHGGFILGQVVLFIYALDEVFRSLRSKRRLNRFLLITIFISIVSGFINPNTYGAISETIKTPSVITEGITEYMSSIDFFLSFGALHIIIYWMLLVLAIIAFIFRFKKDSDIASLLLTTGLGYVSFTQSRYIAFFIIFAPPLIGMFISIIRLKRLAETVLLVTSILFSILLVFRHDLTTYMKNISSTIKGKFISSYYPEAAVRFIKANNFKERLYNYYGWGGYLIWRFYPEKRVFVDGRQLYEDIYVLSRSINNVSVEPLIGGQPYWKAILKSYNINYALIPVFEKIGNVLPLFVELLNDDEWVPVFFTENSVVFARRIPEHYEIIYKFSLPKNLMINDLIAHLELMIKKKPSQISFYIAKGDLLLYSGRILEAEREYKRALDVFPLNSTAREKLEELKMYKKR